MENRKDDLAKYWMEKARRSLKAARNELKYGNYDFCVNRLYYSVFYSVSAVLVVKEQMYKKHSGVRMALHRVFVKEGIIPKKYSTLYDALFQDRQEADYVAFTEFDPEVIEENLKQVEEFIVKFEEILKDYLGNLNWMKYKLLVFSHRRS